MSSSLFEKNIREYFNRYGKNIKTFTGTSNKVLEKAKDGNYTIQLKHNNRKIYLHSKYSPLKEAERFVQKIEDYNIKTVFIIYGMGLGYHILELINHLHKDNSLIIIEPDEEILCKAFSIYDWKELFYRNNTYIFTGTNRESLNHILGEYIDITNVENLQFLNFSQYDRLYADFFKIVIDEIKNYISLFMISKNTRKYFQDKYNENFFNNLLSIMEQNSINDLKNKFNNVPAFIVSAGPSLDKNVRELRDVKDKGIIFSGGRTLSTLIKNNIIPNFVVSMDPGIVAYNVLRKYGNNHIPLITTIVSNDLVVSEHRGDKFYISNSEYRRLIHYFTKKDMDILPLGASVANASAAIAVYLGCNPIIFVGQDLAYTDGKYHADSCILGKEEDDKDERIAVEGIDGNKVWTNSVWNSFLIWMEKFIYHSSNKLFIDATEGGAKIYGTSILTLNEVIKKYCVKSFFVDKEVNRIVNLNKKDYQGEKLENLLTNLKVEVNKVFRISRKGLDYSKNLLNLFESGSINEEDAQRLYIFEEQINKMIKYNPGVADILLKVTDEVHSQNEFIKKINEKNEEKVYRLINRNMETYKQINKTIESINRLIENVIENKIETIKSFQCRIHFTP